jgi:hypothetical protein
MTPSVSRSPGEPRQHWQQQKLPMHWLTQQLRQQRQARGPWLVEEVTLI